jgi:plasmid stability protein
MPTLTLKNIPDGLHARLKASAERNRRSLNSEILVRLEKDIQDISRPVLDPVVHAETLRAFAARLPRVAYQHATRYKRQGRA